MATPMFERVVRVCVESLMTLRRRGPREAHRSGSSIGITGRAARTTVVPAARDHGHRACAGAETATIAARAGSAAPAAAASSDSPAATPIAAAKPSLKAPGDA